MEKSTAAATAPQLPMQQSVEADAIRIDPDRVAAIAAADWSYCSNDEAMRDALENACERLVEKHGLDYGEVMDVLMDVALDVDAAHMEQHSDAMVERAKRGGYRPFKLVDTTVRIEPGQKWGDLLDAGTLHLGQAITVLAACSSMISSARPKEASMIDCATNALTVAEALLLQAGDEMVVALKAGDPS